MPAPVLYPGHHLEGATLTVTGEAAGFSKERLRDRDIGLPYKDSGTAGNRDITSDRGAGGVSQAVDTWIVPAGHNLAGVVLDVASSTDGAVFTSRDSFTPSGSTAIRRTISKLTHRAWRLRSPTPANAPQLHELLFAEAVTLPSAPLYRGQAVGLQANVLDLESYGGYAWALVRGEKRWTAVYPFAGLTDAQRAALEAAYALVDEGAKHLYLLDAEGVLRWVQWLDRQLDFVPTSVNQWDVTLRFREVL